MFSARFIFVSLILFLSSTLAFAQDTDDELTGIFAITLQRNGISFTSVVDINGGTVKRIFDYPQPIYWNADGEGYIIFDNLPQGGCYQVDIVTQEQTLLVPDVQDCVLSPDGTSLAATELNGLALYDSNGENRRLLARNFFNGDQNASFFARPAWSPDGQYVVFGDFFAEGIYVADTSLDDPDTNKLFLESADRHATFDPNTGRIVFSRRTDSGNTEIATMEPDGSDVQTLIDNSDNYLAYSPTFSPDGRYIAYIVDLDVNATADTLIFVANADGSEARALAFPPGADRQPGVYEIIHWSPAGIQVDDLPTVYPEGDWEVPQFDFDMALDCIVTANSESNLRLLPSTNASVVGSIAADETQPATRKIVGSDGQDWYFLANGRWIRSDRVTASDTCESISE